MKDRVTSWGPSLNLKASFIRIAFTSIIVFITVLQAQEVPTFQTSVSLVHINAEVRMRDGRALTGFVSKDFRVFDNDAEQSVVVFSAEEQPLDVILLFDISGSMRQRLKQVTAVARQSLCELRRGDRIATMAFNTDTFLVDSFTDDLIAVEHSVGSVMNLRFGGRTAIQDAVENAVSLFQHGEIKYGRRRAVLVITDNNGLPNHRQARITEKYWESDAVLCGLISGHHKSLADLLHPALSSLYGGVDDIVQKTGGDLIQSDDLAMQFPEMMRRIRRRYSLYYRLPEGVPDTIRTIRVELAPEAQRRYPEARVVARTGYRFGTRDEHGFTRR